MKRGYTEAGWDTIRSWVKQHAQLINEHGAKYAADVARKTPYHLSNKHKREGWSPCLGYCPNHFTIWDVMVFEGLADEGFTKTHNQRFYRGYEPDPAYARSDGERVCEGSPEIIRWESDGGAV